MIRKKCDASQVEKIDEFFMTIVYDIFWEMHLLQISGKKIENFIWMGVHYVVSKRNDFFLRTKEILSK